MNNTVSKVPRPVQPPVQSVGSGLPMSVAQSNFDTTGGSAVASAAPGMSSAQVASASSAAVDDVSTSSSASPYASAMAPSSTPASPTVPVPPNTPTMPVHLPLKVTS
jgi:hypothetical protein